MNLAKKGQCHFSFFKVDFHYLKFNLEYLNIYKWQTKNIGQAKTVRYFVTSNASLVQKLQQLCWMCFQVFKETTKYYGDYY